MKTTQELVKTFQLANTVYLQAINARRSARTEWLLADEDLGKASRAFYAASNKLSNIVELKGRANVDANAGSYDIAKAVLNSSKDTSKAQKNFDDAKARHISTINDERIAEFEKLLAKKEYAAKEVLACKAKAAFSAAEKLEGEAEEEANAAFVELAKRQFEETGKLDFSNIFDVE